MSQFTKGAPVRFTRRNGTQETGKVVGIRQTVKGAWYDVKLPDGKQQSLRAAQMQPA